MAWVFLCAASALAMDDAEALKSFELFRTQWIQKLMKHGFYGRKHVKFVKSDDEPVVRAVYKQLGPVKTTRIKKTSSAQCPYVGVLSYEELVFESTGPTREIARQGPFVCSRRVTITEIFRFSNGKWIY